MTEFIYLIIAVLFILSLRCLSTIKTAKLGNIYAIVGMVLAIAAAFYNTRELLISKVSTVLVVLIVILAGGLIGYYIAKRIKMKDLPQLVAAFHSLIGLTAVCIDTAIFYNSKTFDISTKLEIALGIMIGAITFTGSLVAFGKLQGLLKSKTCLIHNIVIILCLICSICIFLNNATTYVFFAILLTQN